MIAVRRSAVSLRLHRSSSGSSTSQVSTCWRENTRNAGSETPGRRRWAIPVQRARFAARVVDHADHRVRRQVTRIARTQQSSQRVQMSLPGRQPRAVVLQAENQRHPVVDRHHQSVGVGRDDPARRFGSSYRRSSTAVACCPPLGKEKRPDPSARMTASRGSGSAAESSLLVRHTRNGSPQSRHP